jgi:hypothetical protein
VSETSAALGFRAHSGWAAMVALSGPLRSPSVIDRRRVELADRAVAGFPQPYHAAEPLEFEAAERLIGRCVESAGMLAREAMDEIVQDLRGVGYQVRGAGLLLASGRPLPPLAGILASHALIHSAEGELFRDAITNACRHGSLPVTKVKEKEAFARAEEILSLSADAIQRHLLEIGRAIGPPWRQDEKLAALAAWLALVGAQVAH